MELWPPRHLAGQGRGRKGQPASDDRADFHQSQEPAEERAKADYQLRSGKGGWRLEGVEIRASGGRPGGGAGQDRQPDGAIRPADAGERASDWRVGASAADAGAAVV